MIRKTIRGKTIELSDDAAHALERIRAGADMPIDDASREALRFLQLAIFTYAGPRLTGIGSAWLQAPAVDAPPANVPREPTRAKPPAKTKPAPKTVTKTKTKPAAKSKPKPSTAAKASKLSAAQSNRLKELVRKPAPFDDVHPRVRDALIRAGFARKLHGKLTITVAGKAYAKTFK